ncbi:unnamed protein product [Orchesella dallaii]|uniref:Exonuclease domain-containing protein n=1 Tax=Orchesella dallaii TaxID=48710 RepID=A0ABP1PIX3_9HEXA
MEEAQRTAINVLKSLDDSTFQMVVTQAFNVRTPEAQRAVSKRLAKRGSKYSKLGGGIGVSADRKPAECPTLPSQPCHSKAAAKSPFIYQGNLIPENDVLFFDVEKLTLKAPQGGKHQQRASSIAVVNRDRELVLWSFIHYNDHEICQTYPTLTGITREKLKIGQPLAIIQRFTNICFQNNILVGYDMDNDLKSLCVTADKKEDLSSYFVDENNQKYSLRDLCKHFFNDDTIQCGLHSAIQDARRTRDLYMKMKELEEEWPDFKKYPGFVKRSPKSVFVKDNNDICQCNSAKKQKRKGSNRKGNIYYCPD